MGAHLRNGKKISFKKKATAAATVAREQQLRQRSASTGKQQYSSTGLEASSTAGEQHLYRYPSSQEQHVPGDFFSPNRPENSPPSTETRLVLNYQETKLAPLYTLLFPHPRELTQSRGGIHP
jgi:hypothetical protein